MRLLLDEMYSKLVAVRLRERSHDVVSVNERDDLRSAEDLTIFQAMLGERRAILTNNVRHFVPIVSRAVESGVAHYGVVLTSARWLPRTRDRIGVSVELLDELMRANASDDALLNEIRWLTRPT